VFYLQPLLDRAVVVAARLWLIARSIVLAEPQLVVFLIAAVAQVFDFVGSELRHGDALRIEIMINSSLFKCVGIMFL
jgi:hypothetical protein